jgi:serine/threonine-protein kinase
MSPEQASADPAADHRADIYSLGVVAFEMLAGDPPFGRRTAEATIAAHMVESPPPLTTRRAAVPPQLAALVGKCLAKRPADRPQTAKALIESLDSIHSGELRTTTSDGRRFRISPVGVTAAVLLLLLVAAGVIWSVRRSPAGFSNNGAPGIRALAVLPFVNLGGNKQDEYFSDGMTDELSAALSKIPGLRIASRTSTFAVGETDRADLGEIGRRLHVDAVLEGRLRRDGNRLRVTAQLTNVNDGLAIWSDSYEREVKDVFAVQDDISRSIAQALRVAMAPAPSRRERNQGTTDVQAYDFYLRGRYAWYHRDLPRAITYLDSATARDPRFAEAFAALASSYALLPEYVSNPPADVTERARAAAARALELDSTQSEAFNALGLAYVHAWQWKLAESSYQRALALNPGDATAHQWMGELLYVLNRTGESVAEMRRAMELDPLAPVPALAYGYALFLDRQFKAAVTQGERAVELAPKVGIAHERLAEAYLAVGDSVRALAEAKEAFELDSSLVIRAAFYAYFAGVVGDTLTARSMSRRLEQLPRSSPASPSAMFLVYLGMGDRERAIRSLEKGVEERDIAFGGTYPLLADPMFDPLRGDARFARTLTALGLHSP